MSGTFNRLLGDRRSSVELAKNSVAPPDQPKRPGASPPSSREQAQNRTDAGLISAILRLFAGYPQAAGQRAHANRQSTAHAPERDRRRRRSCSHRNGGLATTAQLLTVMTRQQLDVQVAKGGLVRVWHGVYARTQPDLLRRLAALDLVTGQDAVASMGTAAALYGFDTENTTAVHILEPVFGRGRPRVWSSTNATGAPLQWVASRRATPRPGRRWRSPGSCAGRGRSPRSTRPALAMVHRR